MSKTSLSKSTFIRGQQCEKSLYLYKHHYDWQDKISAAQQAVFDQGTTVGELAQQLFPGGVDCTPDNFYQSKKAVEHTRKEIEAGSTIIYEAAFEFNEVLVYADILVKDVKGWKVYEVKSSTSVKEVHIQDAALQGYVLNNSGIELMDISIVHINNQYVKNGSLDIHQLFHVQSIYDAVSNMLSTIPEQVERFKLMLKGSEIPEVAISPHCNDPYDCSFKGHCTKHIPKDSVFHIGNLRLNKKFDLYNQGIIRMTDLPDEYPLTQKQVMQVNGVKEESSSINQAAIQGFIGNLSYPLYFLDFETINPAVPIYDLTRPYEAMVFQYSLHVQAEFNGDCDHFEYLAKTDGIDPRIAFMEQLIEECGSTGDILVYNIGFERGKLANLADIFPKYANDLEAIIDRLKDLMIPFQKGWYYTPAMKGSYSIKYVLPALVPALSYKNLNIQEGGTASSVFEQMAAGGFKGDVDQTREDLLKYCEMDTWAMVKILEVLRGVLE